MVRYERSAGMDALMNPGANLLPRRSPSEPQPRPSPTTLDSPHSGPKSYDAGDMAIENIYASPLASPDAFTRGDKSGSYMSLNEPLGKHAADNISLLSHRSCQPHTKHFDHNQARKYLFRVGGCKLLVTVLFSALMCVTLKAWEGFHGAIVLSKMEVRVFNALMIGLSLCLGLNLLASLQNYASILRWSLLSRRYVSLETFDLMLGLERLSNVVKLMVMSLPLVRRHKYLRRLKWLNHARQDETRWTWIVCLLWLGINVGSQVLVAVSSLFYPMDPSTSPLLAHGNVTVADLSVWTTEKSSSFTGTATDFNGTSLEKAWMYGMEALVYPEFAINDSQTDLSGLAGTPIYKIDNRTYEYRFFNRNPEHQYSDYLLSSRSVQALTSCDKIETRGDVQPDEDDNMVLAMKPPGQDWAAYYPPELAVGAITWTASVFSYCGPRCTNFTVMQRSHESPSGLPFNQTSLFFCNSTLSAVGGGGGKNDVRIASQDESRAVFGTDEFARIAAGAMGWTGFAWNGWKELQFRTYTPGSRWSPSRAVGVSEVEDMLARFTIGAVAAFDDHGMAYTVVKQDMVPTQGQQLNVDWSYMVSILGGICAIQLLALCCLLALADRTIVRDESFFSVAMLLSPVIARLGSEAGMGMSGEEIKNDGRLRFQKMKYSYREGRDGEPNQVDILWEGRDSRESRKSWAAGVYR